MVALWILGILLALILLAAGLFLMYRHENSYVKVV